MILKQVAQKGVVDERLSALKPRVAEARAELDARLNPVSVESLFDDRFGRSVYQEAELRAPVLVPEGVPAAREREIALERENMFSAVAGSDGLGGLHAKRLIQAVDCVFGDSAGDAWRELASFTGSSVGEHPGQWMHDLSTQLAPDYFILLGRNDEPLERLRRLKKVGLALPSVPAQTRRLDTVRPLVNLRFCIGYRRLSEDALPDYVDESFQALTHPNMEGQVAGIAGDLFVIPLSRGLLRTIADDSADVLKTLGEGGNLQDLIEKKYPASRLFRESLGDQGEYWRRDWMTQGKKEGGHEASFSRYPVNVRNFLVQEVAGASDRVVDAGCGTDMYIPREIASAHPGSEVWGVDFPEVSELSPDCPVRYVNGSVLDLTDSIPNDYFTAGVSSFTYAYFSLKEKHDALKNMGEKLISGAPLVLALHHPECGLRDIARAKAELACDKLNNPEPSLTESDRDYWIAAGQIHSRVFTEGLFDDLDSVKRFFGSIDGFRLSKSTVILFEDTKVPIAYGLVLTKE